MLIKTSLHQSPDHSVPSAKAICKQGEIYTNSQTQGDTENGNICKYHCHIHVPTLDPTYTTPTHAIIFNMQSSNTLGSLHSHRKPPRSRIKEVPQREREDYYNSQTRPLSLCSPKKNTPHLHTAKVKKIFFPVYKFLLVYK